ncbi:Rossmann-like domain-containing protein [Azotobacter armeniacus]
MNGLYDWLLGHAVSAASDEPVGRVCLGLSWTLAEVGDGLGFAFGPRQVPRTLSWAGTLGGQASDRLYPWLLSWDSAEAAVGLAVVNAAINRASPCLSQAQPLRGDAPGNLSVFEHFRPRLEGRKVAVIGHYPGLAQLWQDLPYQCFERQPQDGDLPDAAVEYLLPEADWVFITASSLANKTLPRLLELSSHAQVVLMGPSLPWIYDWRRFGVNYLAGVRVQDAQAVRQVVAEGGGTRLFAGPVEYALLALDS